MVDKILWQLCTPIFLTIQKSSPWVETRPLQLGPIAQRQFLTPVVLFPRSNLYSNLSWSTKMGFPRRLGLMHNGNSVSRVSVTGKVESHGWVLTLMSKIIRSALKNFHRENWLLVGTCANCVFLWLYCPLPKCELWLYTFYFCNASVPLSYTGQPFCIQICLCPPR